MIFFSSHQKVFHINLVFWLDWFYSYLSFFVWLIYFLPIVFVFIGFSSLLLVQIERKSLDLGDFSLLPCRAF